MDEADEIVRALESSLSRIKWRLKPSSKRRLQTGSFTPSLPLYTFLLDSISAEKSNKLVFFFYPTSRYRVSLPFFKTALIKVSGFLLLLIDPETGRVLESL
ncbi:hypothetical protein DM860_005742 [Cuscuta australis]|uniref:Uncharacterized protein n=1 Tax=Cuscuta australis TaxID=267555 RepID=A0A328DUU7_9ASTE|nr:hypothetical protein DM860_005742 [Cuscuta australis]